MAKRTALLMISAGALAMLIALYLYSGVPLARL